MDSICLKMHPTDQLTFEMEEHIDLYFHTLSHFIIHDCKENIFSFDYFSLISSLKKVLDLDPMDLVRSFDELYECYQKEKSLLHVQFLPFCTDSTDGLFQIMNPSNSVFMDALYNELKIDTSNNRVRRFLEKFRNTLLDEHYSFFKGMRKEIQSLMIDKDALSKLSDLCMGRGAKIFSTVHSMLNKSIYVYVCPSLTEHARVMERNGDIFIAIGHLSTEETVVPRFLNIIHEASHRIVDGLAVKTYLRMLSGVFSEEAEMIHLLKEISVIYLNKQLILKYNPELMKYFERVYNLEKLIKLFIKKGETYEKEKNLQVLLSDFFEDVFSSSLIHT